MKDNKVAIITAGGSGIGAGTARKLASEGYRVAVLSSSGKGEALAESLGGIGMTGSNRSPRDLAELVGRVRSAWGRVDVLVNSAGHGPKGGVLELEDDDWAAGMDVYLLNVIRPTRLVVPMMLEQRSGVILNISTFAAVEPDPLFPTSSVFRAALSAYAKLFAEEYAPHNLRMNNILPGYIDSLPEAADRRARIPMGRYGRTAEVAGLVAYLASDDAAYITGQNLRIDGGLTRSL